MKSKIQIAYLLNPDPVFFNELDFKLIGMFEKQGASVIQVQLSDLYVKLDPSGVKFYKNDQHIQFDAFFSYGYMSYQNKIYYEYLINSVHSAKKVVIHNPNVIKILENKLLQANKFAEYKVPFPQTYFGFHLNSVKALFKNNFKDKAITKTLSDYGGDGVKLTKHVDEAITLVSKNLWDNRTCLTQEFIDDSWGKSIRVLIIGGKPYAAAEYEDLSRDFRSNVSYHDSFKLNSLMNSPKKQEYFDIALKAVLSIDDGKTISVAGVDLLDSEKRGIVVLEINCWPDLYDIQQSTQLPIFETLVDNLYSKVLASTDLNKTE